MAGKLVQNLRQGHFYYQLLVDTLDYLLFNQHTSHLFNLHSGPEAIQMPGFLLQSA